MRVLELFGGIGGCAAALGSRATVAAAVDIHAGALAVYRENFRHPTQIASVESLSDERLTAWAADLWWLSPPCQPFTQRGHQRDLDDPRCRGLRAVIDRLGVHRPRYLALENVPGFEGSRAHARLRRALASAGYAVHELVLCPTALGIPNRRRRFYLVAGRDALRAPIPAVAPRRPLAHFLDPDPDPALAVDAAVIETYRHALDIVDVGDPHAVSACFTSAYGRSPVRSGSYLRTGNGLRYFAPTEILRLLGFPASYRLPDTLPHRRTWPLVGNALSIPAVRTVLAAIPELG